MIQSFFIFNINHKFNEHDVALNTTLKVLRNT